MLTCFCMLWWAFNNEKWRREEKKRFMWFEMKKWEAQKLTQNNNNINMFINLYFMYARIATSRFVIIYFS